MSTNYYLERNICPMCKRNEEIHIGKSSCGWTFYLHTTDEFPSLEAWLPALLKYRIRNEYGEHIAFSEMIKCIVDRGEGLKRHPVDGVTTSGYGTWDCLDRTFS